MRSIKTTSIVLLALPALVASEARKSIPGGRAAAVRHGQVGPARAEGPRVGVGSHRLGSFCRETRLKWQRPLTGVARFRDAILIPRDLLLSRDRRERLVRRKNGVSRQKLVKSLVFPLDSLVLTAPELRRGPRTVAEGGPPLVACAT